MYISPETIAAWPTPNYIHPQTRGSSVIAIHSILYAIVLGVVSLRIFTRLYISRSFGYDDTFILIATVLTTAFVIVLLVAEVHYGWNRHAWDVYPPTVAIGEKLSMTSQVLFAAASTCTRLSMLFLMRRILSAGNPKLQRVITFAMIFMAIDAWIFVAVVIFQCRPISAYWTLSLTPQHCINENIHLLVKGSFNIIYDFWVVLIPIPIVLRLNLPLRQRIIVALLFGAGFVVCFAGIVRTYYMWKVTDGYHDVTWDAYPVWLGSAVELYVGILCTSAPPTKPFFVRYFPGLLSANSLCIQTSPTLVSRKNNAMDRVHSVFSRDTDRSVGLEFEEMAGRGDDSKRGAIRKDIQISQSWLDFSVTPHSSTTASVREFVH